MNTSKTIPTTVRGTKSLFTSALCLCALVAVLGSASNAFGQVIRIQKQAVVEPRQDVRLGDIATVTGTDARTAEGLANLVILADVRDTRIIRAESVLFAVVAQIGPGGVSDHLQVAGSATCEVKVADESPSHATKTAKDASPATVESPRITPPEAPSTKIATTVPASQETVPLTLAKLLIAELQLNLNAREEDLRVSFNTLNPLLDQPAPKGQKWVFRPLTRTFLGTVQFEAQLVDGVRVAQKFNVQAQVLRRTMVLVATAPLSKGDVLTKDQFKADDVWLDRQMPTLLINEKDALGLEALRSVNIGAMLDQRDFKPVEMAARGDAVQVVFIHGSLKVQMKGRAVEGGKLHDTIQVKNETTNESYPAVLIGKRLAVVGGTLDEAQEKQLREMQ